MKYIKARDRFLFNSEEKLLGSVSPVKQNQKLILEDSGPFANDIPWGNSLVGRLINFGRRKALNTYKLGRIQFVIKGLKDAFEELLDSSGLAGLSEEDKAQFTKLSVFNFLDALKKEVDKGESLIEIKTLTESAISDIENYEEFDDKDELLKKLRDFLKFLDQFKEEEKAEGKEISTEGSSKKTDEKTLDKIYPTLVKNLKSLSLILETYSRVNLAGESTQKKAASTSVGSYTTKQGDTLKKISEMPINKKNMAPKDILVKNQTVTFNGKKKRLSEFFKPGVEKTTQQLPAGIKIVLESNDEIYLQDIFEKDTFSTGGSSERSNVKSGEDHLTQAFSKIKKDIESLISEREKGIGITPAFINSITAKSVDEKGKNEIKLLFKEINRFLVGDKKTTIQDKDPLYNESLEIISDKNKRVIVAEKIARFTKRAIQFDKEGLYGGLGEFGKALESFVETIKEIMKVNFNTSSEEVIVKKLGEKNESRLLGYERFLTSINEADEEKESDVSDRKENIFTKIKDYFNKNIDMKKFSMEKTEVVKVKTNLDKKLEEAKKEKLVINGLDPVLRIVKLFNRAYKLHTTKVIPNVGTSDGRVSADEFANYDCFGDGTRMTAGISGGPYRNKAIFDSWEKAVLDIFEQRKYQRIFLPETTLKVGDREIEKAGANLGKFMRDMLDGEELYKSGGKYSGENLGKQREFLEKYFAYDQKEPNSVKQDITVGNDAVAVSEVANDIKQLSLTFTKDPMKFEKIEDLEKTFFSVSATNKDNKDVIWHFMIQSIEGEYANLVFSNTFFYFRDYILTLTRKSPILDKGGLEKLKLTKDQTLERGTQNYKLRACRVKIGLLFSPNGNSNLTGQKIEIPSLVKYSGGKNRPDLQPTTEESLELKVNRVFTLSTTGDDKKRFSLKENWKNDDFISNVGGFKSIGSTSGIKTVELKKK